MSDALDHERVDEGVARDHVVDDAIVERVAVGASAALMRAELALQLRSEASTAGRLIRAGRASARQRIRSSAASDSDATSVGSAM